MEICQNNFNQSEALNYNTNLNYPILFNPVLFSVITLFVILLIQRKFKSKSQQQTKIDKFTSSWQEYCQNHNYNPQFGYLCSPKQCLVESQYPQLIKVVSQIPNIKSEEKLRELVLELNKLNLNETKSKPKRQLMIIRDKLSMIQGKFIALQKGKKQQIFIPAPLSTWIKQISDILGVKDGVTAALSSMWQYKDLQNEEVAKVIQPDQKFEEPTMDNIRLKYNYTSYTKDQFLFFGTSIVSSFHMKFIVQFGYKINQIIRDDKINQTQKKKLIIELFQSMIQKFDIIYPVMKNLYQNLDPKIFFDQIRTHVDSFENGRFQNYSGQFSSGGGSTGQDPNYQMFQRLMGITIPWAFMNTQKKLREGMYQDHRKMQDYFQKYSMIKEYCQKDDELSYYYNKVLSKYADKNRYHNAYIRKYILDRVDKALHNIMKGTGGNLIINVMSRWRAIVQNKLSCRRDEQQKDGHEQIGQHINEIKNQQEDSLLQNQGQKVQIKVKNQ